MYLLVIVMVLVFLCVLVLATGVIVALLIARYEIRRHNERWRFG